jgi:hypothetical protein
VTSQAPAPVGQAGSGVIDTVVQTADQVLPPVPAAPTNAGPAVSP